jgi:hypothetical protein
VIKPTDDRPGAWVSDHNPFFIGPHADAPSFILFAVPSAFLYLVDREKLLAPARRAGT